MSFLFGSAPKSTSTPSVWKPQRPYVKAGFEGAKDLYDEQIGSPGYQGNYYAGMSDPQKATYDSMYAYGGSVPGQVAGFSNVAASNMPWAQQFGGNAAGVFNRAGTDPTSTIMGNAGQYALNPHLDGQIDAATRDISRGLREDQLPQLNRDASDSGNAYSSRAGTAEGILIRGAQDRAGDIASSMRSDAWKTGLGMAQSQWNQGTQDQLAANAQVGASADLASKALGTQNDLTNKGFASQIAAGTAGQTDAQGYLDEAFKKFQAGDTRDWDILSRYFNIAGWGGGPGTTTTQTGGSAGLLGTVIGGLSAAKGAGVFGK